MAEQIEVADGFVLSGEDIWITYRDYDRSWYVNRSKVVGFDYHPQYDKIIKLAIDSEKFIGNVSMPFEDAKILCFKDYDKADIKRIEMVMCGE